MGVFCCAARRDVPGGPPGGGGGGAAGARDPIMKQKGNQNMSHSVYYGGTDQKAVLRVVALLRKVRIVGSTNTNLEIIRTCWRWSWRRWWRRHWRACYNSRYTIVRSNIHQRAKAREINGQAGEGPGGGGGGATGGRGAKQSIYKNRPITPISQIRAAHQNQ